MGQVLPVKEEVSKVREKKARSRRREHFPLRRSAVALVQNLTDTVQSSESHKLLAVTKQMRP